MRALIAAFIWLLCLPGAALAQSWGNEVPGYLSITNCPGGNTPCFIAYGSAVPITPGPAQPLTYASTGSASVGTGSGQLVAAGAYKTALQVCTLPGSTTNVWLNPSGAAAVVNTGVPVFSNGGCTNFGTAALPIPVAAINAITDSGSSQTVTLGGG